MAIIKINLYRVSSNPVDKVTVSLTGPHGELVNHEFSLIWLDNEDWQVIFWSLKLHAKDLGTWPDDPKIIRRAEELDLFSSGYPLSRRLRIIGNKLYETVFGSKNIKDLFRQLLIQTSEDISIVQLNLPDEESILQAYPWELLHDGEKFLFDGRHAILVRLTDSKYSSLKSTKLKEELRVLLVDPRPKMPAKYPDLPLLARPHLRKLSVQTRHKFLIEDLPDVSPPQATLQKLVEYFKDPLDDVHILHIDTYSDFGWVCHQCGTLNTPINTRCQSQKCEPNPPERIEVQGYLAYITSEEKKHLAWVSGQHLGKLLANSKIQLILLSGYECGLEKGFSGLNSIANVLIGYGIPAVVIVQFPLDEEATEVFIEDFYMALMQGRPLTEALAEARMGLLSISSDDFWYRPVLYLSTGPNNYRGEIFTGASSQEDHKALFAAEIPSISYLEIEPPLGTMRLDSKFYIERAADEKCRELLSTPYAATLLIQGPRQTGKSSLMQRMLNWAARERKMKSTFIDFQLLSKQSLSEEEKLLTELCLIIGDALEIPEATDKYWTGPRTPVMKCSQYLADYILPKVKKPFILAMDEVERMFDSPFRLNFFGMLRGWHNIRGRNEDFAKMTLFLCSSTESFLFIDDPHQSPFNVAERIMLQDFTLVEVNELNKRYNSPLSLEQINDLMNLIGGHPYLTNRAFYLLATNKIDMGTLLAEAVDDKGPFGDHFNDYLVRVLQQLELKEALTYICHNHTYEKNQLFYRLSGAGLIKQVGEKVILRNNLYARYFEKHLT